MHPPFKIIPHTADVRLWIGGKTLETLFENAAAGLLAVHELEPGKGALDVRASVRLEADSLEELMVDWLNELIYRISGERWVPEDVRVSKAGPRRLEADAAGRGITGSWGPGCEIKAATYHGLKVAKEGELWTATVILDV